MRPQTHPSGNLGPPLRFRSRAARPRGATNQVLAVLTTFLMLALAMGATGAAANVIVPNSPPPPLGVFNNSPAITLLDPPPLPPAPSHLISAYMQYNNPIWPNALSTSFSPDGGVTWVPSATPPMLPPIGGCDDPAIASSTGMVYVAMAWADAQFGAHSQSGILVSTSADGGNTFGPVVQVNVGPAPMWQTEPKIDADTYVTSPFYGYLYTTWEVDLAGGLMNSNIMVARSIDQGLTWPVVVQQVINDNPGADLGLWPDLDIGSDGREVVAWLDTPVQAQHQGDLYFDQSLDGGLTFGADIPVTSFWCVPTMLRDAAFANTHNAFSYCSVAVDPSNPLRIGMAYAGDPDTGPCFENKVDQDPIDFGQAWLLNPFSGATNISTGSTRVHGTWIDDRTGQVEVMYNGASTTSMPCTYGSPDVLVSTQTALPRGIPNNANIEAMGTNVYITWDENAGTDIPYFIFFNNSLDEGATWKPAAINLDFAGRPAHTPIVASNYMNNVCVAWLQIQPDGTQRLYENYSLDGGNTFQPSEIVVPTTQPVLAHDIAAAYDASGGGTHVVYLTWSQVDASGVGSEIWFSYSYNGGASWAAPVRLDASPLGTNSFAPKIATSGRYVYVTWVDDRTLGQYDVYCASNTNWGAFGWNPEVRVDVGTGPGMSRDYFSQIACNGPDVWIVYESDRLANPATEDIFIAYSNSFGMSWTETRLDTGDPNSTSHSVYPRIALGGTDIATYVYVAWQDDRNSVGTGIGYDIYGNISYDGGLTWMVSDFRIDTGTQPGRYNSETPHVSGGPSAFYLWRDTRGSTGHEVMGNAFHYGPDDGDIFYTESLDGGQTWLHPPLRVNDDPGIQDQSHPWVDIKPNGIVDVIWYDKRNSPLDQDLEVMFAALLPGAPSFGPNMPVTTAPFPQPAPGWWVGDYNGLVVDQTHAHVVWTDTRRDGLFGDIYYNNIENPPLPASGACCPPGTTSCVVVTAANCAAMGGAYQGDGTSCTPNPCVSAVPDGRDRLGYQLSSYPNPFNPQTVISYELDRGLPVRLDIYDIKGRLVKVLVDLPYQPSGRQEVRWNGRDAAGRQVGAGVYIAHLRAGGKVENHRLVLLK
jgi:hypothetical protein